MHRYKCNIKKDDKVKIIAGKDKSKIGKVLKVDRKKQRIVVENINIVKRHTRPSATNRLCRIPVRRWPLRKKGRRARRGSPQG